jgi:hypothetical protein
MSFDVRSCQKSKCSDLQSLIREAQAGCCSFCKLFCDVAVKVYGDQVPRIEFNIDGDTASCGILDHNAPWSGFQLYTDDGKFD